MLLLPLFLFFSFVFSIPHLHIKRELRDATNITYHFTKGVVESIPEAVSDIGEMVFHPKQTYYHMEFELQHPNKTAHAVMEAIKEKCQQIGSSECYGKLVGNILIIVATDGAGELAEGLEVAGTLQRGTQVADTAHIGGLNNHAGQKGYTKYNATTNSTKKEPEKPCETTTMLPKI